MMPLIISYLNAGGNVLLACRYASRFITGDLLTYSRLSFSEDDKAKIEVSIPGLTAEIDGLVDQSGAGLSYTDLPAIPTHEDVTVIFSVDGFPTTVGGVLVGPEAGGKFIFIAGRPYRYEHDPVKTNFDYIFTNFFGEE
jgi:hypothetical protein